MNRHRSSTIQWRLFSSVKIRDQITATWRINSSRKRWRSKIWRPDWKVQGKIRWHFGMDSLCLGNFFGKRRTKAKVSMLLQSELFQTLRVLQSNSGTFRRWSRWSITAGQCTVTGWLHPKYMYHTGNAKEMHSIIKSGLIPGGRSLKKYRQSVFFTAVNPMYTGKDLEEV